MSVFHDNDIIRVQGLDYRITEVEVEHPWGDAVIRLERKDPPPIHLHRFFPNASVGPHTHCTVVFHHEKTPSMCPNFWCRDCEQIGYCVPWTYEKSSGYWLHVCACGVSGGE